MVSSKATSVSQYLAELPPERRQQIEPIYKLVRKHMPKGFEEGMLYGMIGWYIPLKAYPETYNKQPLGIVALAAQKNFNTLYLMCAYDDSEDLKALQAGFKAAGKKLDMGKSCVHFKSPDDLALDAITAAIKSTPPAKLIRNYEESRKQTKRGK
jgi:hypothetical protein